MNSFYKIIGLTVIIAFSNCVFGMEQGNEEIPTVSSGQEGAEENELFIRFNKLLEDDYCSQISDWDEGYSIFLKMLTLEQRRKVFHDMRREFMTRGDGSKIKSDLLNFMGNKYQCTTTREKISTIFLEGDYFTLSFYVKCRVDNQREISIQEIPDPEKTSLLTEMNKIVMGAKYYQGNDLSFEKSLDNHNYVCSIPAHGITAYHQFKKLGPLKEVADVEKQSAALPKNYIGQSFRGQTTSNLGDLIFQHNALTEMVEDSIKPDDKVLEIGASRGHQSFRFLQRGAKVTAVDLSEEDLNSLTAHTPKKLRENLNTIVAKFPQELTLDVKNPSEKFDVIYMSHVAHYLSGEELRQGIQKIGDLIKPGEGRFYFQALTPYSNPYVWRMYYADYFLSELLRPSKNRGGQALNEWPGYFTEEEKHHYHAIRPESVDLFSGMPDFGHPIHPHIIKRELEKAGFTVLYVGFLPLSHPYGEYLFPLPYEVHETYVKVPDLSKIPGFKEKVERIVAKYDERIQAHRQASNQSKLIDFKTLLEHDRRMYQNDNRWYWEHNKPLNRLATMDTVIVVACKGCK